MFNLYIFYRDKMDYSYSKPNYTQRNADLLSAAHLGNLDKLVMSTGLSDNQQCSVH